MNKILILGTGKFALAIAHLLEFNVKEITFAGRDKKQLNELSTFNKNSKVYNHLFNLKIKTVDISNNINFSFFDVVFYCLPTECQKITENIPVNIPIIFTCKGYYDNFIFKKYSN